MQGSTKWVAIGHESVPSQKACQGGRNGLLPLCSGGRLVAVGHAIGRPLHAAVELRLMCPVAQNALRVEGERVFVAPRPRCTPAIVARRFDLADFVYPN